MNKLLFALALTLPVTLLSQVVPPPATQAEVTAGVNRFKYVTPFTLNGAIGGGSGSSAFNVGNTLFVRTNGDNATAVRGRIDKPYLTIDAACDAAVVGDLVHVGPGSYTDHDLLRRGVNMVGDPAADLSWTDTGDGIGFWDDRPLGAVGTTNFIYWPGTIHYSSEDPFTYNGCVTITNATTMINCYIGRANTLFFDAREKGNGTFVIINCSMAILRIDFNDELEAVGDSYGSLLYWENGETHLDFYRSTGDNGYGLWLQEPAGQPAADLYVTGQYMESFVGVGNPTMVRFTGSNANWKAWVNIQEVSNLGGAGYAVGMDGTGGKLYCNFSKLGNGLGSPAILNGGGELWYTGQKVSSSAHWFLGRSNSISHIDVQHWEDVFTNITVGFRFEGGQHTIQNGRAKVLNGRGVEHVGGTNRLINMSIDTFGTNTIATVTNCFPVVMGSGTSNLVLQDCYLRGPIATASGGAWSLWSSNSAAHVLNKHTVCNSNAFSVHGIITALVTNQPQLR